MIEEPPRIRVLLIEDNPVDVRLIQVMLSKAGNNTFKLVHADRVASGLQRLEEGDIQVVLLDLSLPDSSGLETFVRVHAQVPHLPIVVMSGFSDETVAVNSVQVGAQDYLVKGHVDGHLLVRALRYAIERKKTAEQLTLYAQELREKHAQMEQEMNMARKIQQVFIPHQYPTFPHGVEPHKSALSFTHRYFTSGAVGGDFFNVRALSDTKAGVFICDVMGHDVSSALITAMMRGLVEELTHLADQPGQLLTQINQDLRAILQQTGTMMYATAFYLVADLENRLIRFANAGHPHPFLVHRDNCQVSLLRATEHKSQPALGMMDGVQFLSSSTPLTPNDLVMLFTDGLYEVEGKGENFYSPDLLLQAIQSRANRPVPLLLDDILGEIRDYSVNREFDDDVCVIGMEVNRVAKEGASPLDEPPL